MYHILITLPHLLWSNVQNIAIIGDRVRDSYGRITRPVFCQCEAPGTDLPDCGPHSANFWKQLFPSFSSSHTPTLPSPPVLSSPTFPPFFPLSASPFYPLPLSFPSSSPRAHPFRQAGVVCLQVKLCDPHLSALEVRFSRRGAIQIYVYLYLYPLCAAREYEERCIQANPSGFGGAQPPNSY